MLHEQYDPGNEQGSETNMNQPESPLSPSELRNKALSLRNAGNEILLNLPSFRQAAIREVLGLSQSGSVDFSLEDRQYSYYRTHHREPLMQFRTTVSISSYYPYIICNGFVIQYKDSSRNNGQVCISVPYKIEYPTECSLGDISMDNPAVMQHLSIFYSAYESVTNMKKRYSKNQMAIECVSQFLEDMKRSTQG